MTLNKTFGLLAAAILAVLIGSSSAFAGSCKTPKRQPATTALMKLVNKDKSLRDSLQESIKLGQRINSDPKTNPVATLQDYYDFIDALVTYDPRNIDSGLGRDGIRISMDGKNYCNWNILDILSYSYFLVDRQLTTDPRGQVQFKNKAFSNWMRKIAENWGAYLETPDSARYIPSFENDPTFGDWYCPPKGHPYRTFQEFFTKELCARNYPTGSRKVEGYKDPRTVVSIGDSNSMGYWPISDDGKLVTDYDRVSQAGRMIKGKLYSDISEFILGGPGEITLKQFGHIDPKIFNGGTYTHQFLNVNNYHRLHLPIGGKVVFMRHFKSATRMKSSWKPALSDKDVGYYAPLDTPDWQFGQTRLVIGIKTPEHGIVIVAPMGMAQVSAIPVRDWVKEGVMAKKGWEFANFAFGGSDFVILFEKKARFQMTVPHTKPVSPGAGVNYQPSLQGEKYGCLGGITTCSDKAEFPPPYPK